MAALSLLCKSPISLSSSQITGNILRNVSISRAVSLAVPRSSRSWQNASRSRLCSQFHGAKLDFAKVSNNVSLWKSARSMHGMAVAFTEDNHSHEETISMDELKASQIKKVVASKTRN